MPRLSRPFVAILLAAALAIFAAAPAMAYGSNDNWQLGFSGTGVTPGTGQGFGFWGWCAFSGITSGTDGDCQFSQYVHTSGGGGFTCQESWDITSWDASGGTFVINAASITVHPSSLTGPCLALFPGLGGLPVDTGFPAKADHYNFGSIFGAAGEFQIQVTQIP